MHFGKCINIFWVSSRSHWQQFFSVNESGILLLAPDGIKKKLRERGSLKKR